jgi:hypothetical protein
MRRLAAALIEADRYLSRRMSIVVSVAVAIPSLAFAAYLSFAPDHLRILAGIANDAPGYMYYDVSRPVGYPLFLSLVRAVCGSIWAVSYIQLLLFCTATAVLGLCYFTMFGSVALMAVLEVAIVGYPGPVLLAQHVGSDSLSATVLMLFASATICFVYARRFWAVVAMSVLAAISISMRPVNVALVGAGIFAMLIVGEWRLGTRLAWCAVIIAGLALGLGITPVVHQGMYGHVSTASPLARGLLQKVMFIPPAADAKDIGCGDGYIDGVLAPANRYLENVPVAFRALFELRYSGYLRFEVIIPGLVKKYGYSSPAQVDDILMCYALARMAEAPGAVLREVAAEYWKLLTNWTYITAGEHDALAQYKAAHPPVIAPAVERAPDDQELRTRAAAELAALGIGGGDGTMDDAFDVPRARPLALILGLALVQMTAGAVSLIGMATALSAIFRWKVVDPRWVVIALLGTAVQGVMVLTAVVEIALPRYLFPLWPLMCAMLAAAASFAYEWIEGSGVRSDLRPGERGRDWRITDGSNA